MDPKSSASIRRVLALVRKDLLEEYRARYAISTLLVFAVTILVVVGFAAGMDPLPGHLHSSFIWLVLFFAAVTGIDRSFVKEEEKNTSPTLRLAADPDVVYAGKLAFNFLVLLALAALVLPLYVILMNPPVKNAPLLVAMVVAGVWCLAVTTTILAAIVAKTGTRNALLPVLSFPLLLAVLTTVVSGTTMALEGAGFTGARQELQFLLSYSVVMLTVSWLLFPYVWND
ncbi:MAG: heme exporter protein CcmB [Bacillota bacterium]